MSDRIKYFLEESKMPKTWYNISADLPKPLSPVLHPGTLKPIGPDDLAPWKRTTRYRMQFTFLVSIESELFKKRTFFT